MRLRRVRCRVCSRSEPTIRVTGVPSESQETGMARNIEIKARAADFESQRKIAEALAGHGPERLVQEDTFFECPAGRLKLRAFSDGTGELIQYHREDAEGPKESRYVIHPTKDADSLKTVLAEALGVRAVVRKVRTLYMAGRTRIHLDTVEGLGRFIELEVVLRPEQSPDEGAKEAGRLMEQLGIRECDLVPEAYVDLLLAGEGGEAPRRSIGPDAIL